MEEPTETNENAAIEGDHQLDLETIRLIPCPYSDIIAEFADVEIFVISLDSLLLELCAHRYHNWTLGGQTIVLCEQVKQFLGGLEELNAKFKLVTFTELAPLFQQDAFLAFLHPFLLSWVAKSKWADDLDTFKSPLDEKWNDYLYQLTPSFMLLSLENPPNIVNEPINFADRFISLAFALINEAIPVVLFSGFVINFTSVNAFRFSTIPLNIDKFKQKIRDKWPECPNQTSQPHNSQLVASCQDIAEFWAVVLCEELKETEIDGETFEEFQKFCNAVLLSALVCVELGVKRRYLDVEEEQRKGPSPTANKFRRKLLERAQKLLSGSVAESIHFALDDLWDGRMVFTCFRRIMSGEKVLPLRRQEKFAQLHKSAGLAVAIPTDLEDKLLDPMSPSENPGGQNQIEQCPFYTVNNELLRQFIPDLIENVDAHQKLKLNWVGKFNDIEDPLLIREEEQRELEKMQMADSRKANRLLWRRQDLSKWYQLFSDSLEGQMLVDFTRVPKTNVVETTETNGKQQIEKKEKEGGKKEKDATGGKAGKKGGKPGAGGGKAGTQLSKKDQILKESREKKNKEQVDSDKQKIEYATGIKANAIAALDDLLRRLELDESKALCMYQKMLRYNEIKRKFNTFGPRWALVFRVLQNGVAEKAYSLDINLVYYQLQYGGRMLDILSEPKKDERVTGFLPDAWQRKMLDAVDQDKSALIVAPTSAGKTFVSYYCIEKVLRKSNDDVVVYISPSKALTNQYIGSVYARFRSKNMSGGKVLYGIYTNEILNNPLNCQVLVTIPDCFEQILLSTSSKCQEFISRIRYVILDEVHCINQKDTQGLSLGHIWEHIFLLIRCPFLALSATIGNIEELRNWLQGAEQLKPIDDTSARKVELITYDERWSELEIAVQKIRECPKGVQFETDEAKFLRGTSVASGDIADELVDDATASANDRASVTSRASNNNSPVPSESQATWTDVIQFFNPFSVYKLDKLRMFGIPADQRLTARQVLELYQMMSDVDETVKKEFEPCKYFKQFFVASSADDPVWLNRQHLRNFETALKDRFVQWMQEDKSKIDRIFNRFESEIRDEFEKRSKLSNMRNSALFNIMRLVDQLKQKAQIPALCFNDDREICEHLAIRVFNELQKREENYKSSPLFQNRYNFKAEEKAQKLAKRKRDEEEKAAKRKTKRTDEEGNVERGEKKDDTSPADSDQFALLRIRMREDLNRFKVYGPWTDEDIYNRVVERMRKTKSKDPMKKSTEILVKLFERGIGYHHDGLSNAERSAVEALFRRGFLGVVFSTSTLALGMNLPCKTVVFGIDTPKLTPLQFRQMSGRAGRRGFDPAGTVIFMSLPTSKIRRLLTASLATLRGNAPFTAAFLLRLFAYINPEVDGKRNKLETNETQKLKGGGGAAKGLKQQLLDPSDVQNEVVRRKAALTLLMAPFVLKTKHKRCYLHGFAQFALHMSQREPGNLVFVRLLQEGVFHRYFGKCNLFIKVYLGPSKGMCSSD
uniref:Helicase ATP-binding domain-containing protein n=1 Tax=Globodera pallida TaxID=36090 RepID=A0A183BTL5_GLOPA